MIFPSKLLTGLSKILWNLDEFPASLDPKLTIWKINGVKLWQNDLQSWKALSNESHSTTDVCTTQMKRQCKSIPYIYTFY